ncbi:MAG: 30S ribosome-binding factor RbfA [bacterium]
MHSRADRIKKALMREISDIIQKNLRDPRIPTIVSIIDIDLSADYSYAKVFISVFGSEEERRQAIEALEEKTSYVRGEVSKRIRLRHTPAISFKLDDSLERGSKITELLDKISRGEI